MLAHSGKMTRHSGKKWQAAQLLNAVAFTAAASVLGMISEVAICVIAWICTSFVDCNAFTWIALKSFPSNLNVSVTAYLTPGLTGVGVVFSVLKPERPCMQNSSLCILFAPCTPRLAC